MSEHRKNPARQEGESGYLQDGQLEIRKIVARAAAAAILVPGGILIAAYILYSPKKLQKENAARIAEYKKLLLLARMSEHASRQSINFLREANRVKYAELSAVRQKASNAINELTLELAQAEKCQASGYRFAHRAKQLLDDANFSRLDEVFRLERILKDVAAETVD